MVPNVAVDGGGAHDAFGHGDDALHRLGLEGEAVAGGAEAIPVEDVDGPLAGATNHLPAFLHQRHRGQITGLILRQQLEPAPLDVEDPHGAVATVTQRGGTRCEMELRPGRTGDLLDPTWP